MKLDWRPLHQALKDLQSNGIALPFWWRDDDAAKATPELERLTRMSEDLDVPCHLAVIPDRIEPSLHPVIDMAPLLVPMVHGWRHQRHFLKGKKDTEFGIRRPNDVAETALALDRMHSGFGTRLLPIFVPPWNMIAPSLLPVLAEQGYVGVSTFTPRTARLPVPGLVQINTHIDPIDWRGTRNLVAPEQLLTLMTENIRDRINGRSDPLEPMGILTHHLVHTQPIWDFTYACLSELRAAGASPVNLKHFEGDLP